MNEYCKISNIAIFLKRAVENERNRQTLRSAQGDIKLAALRFCADNEDTAKRLYNLNGRAIQLR